MRSVVRLKNVKNSMIAMPVTAQMSWRIQAPEFRALPVSRPAE